jgi:hypothetical protein
LERFEVKKGERRRKRKMEKEEIGINNRRFERREIK